MMHRPGFDLYANTYFSYQPDQIWIIHPDGVKDIPLMHEPWAGPTTLTIDDKERIDLAELNQYVESEKNSRYYNSMRKPMQFWAEVAIFSVHGRDVLDKQTNERYWDLRLVSARVKTKSVAIEDALLGGVYEGAQLVKRPPQLNTYCRLTRSAVIAKYFSAELVHASPEDECKYISSQVDEYGDRTQCTHPVAQYRRFEPIVYVQYYMHGCELRKAGRV
jgi:hypothetical protein